ncbi:hypothetical protein JXC34_03735 [Candidatus Woesearchaeota archaeon]|nr:hypothetical protein [Candidatus Woesearchaeota archaeon]
MVKKVRVLLFMISLFLIVSAVSAQSSQIYVSNSGDWEDVYSVMLYSSLSGTQGYFLVSTRHSTLLINQLNPDNEYQIISSSDNPYVVGYKAILESRGFENVEETRINNVNLELARRLPDNIDSFIIIDNSYGYNAISVAPYAALSKSYVLFADKRNINQVVSYLNSRNPSSVILYGQVDREVKTELESFDPEVINNGDRFSDNQVIVDKYQALHIGLKGSPKKQAILTNGEFIEQEIMSGVEPVVFIGRANVPDQVKEYIQEGDIDIGILIGNELIGSATYIRRELGISVFVKFAQSARAPTGSISPVEDLDRFYLPRYILDLDIFSVSYNRLAKRIEVTYQNKVDLSAFLKGTITLRYDDGTQVLGDEEAIFIDKSEFKTLIYDKKSDGSDIDPMQGNITAEVFTIFGESKKTLEYTLRKTVQVDTIDILDSSKIEFGKVLYDRRSGKFLVEVKNTGDVDVFVNLEILDLLINDELISVGADEVVFIKKGESVFIEVNVEMDDQDIEDNPIVRIRAYYGERERSLVNVLEGEFSYGFTGLGYLTGQVLKDIGKNAILYSPLVIILILLILIAGMKKKCPHCGEINNLRAKRCKKCNGEI